MVATNLPVSVSDVSTAMLIKICVIWNVTPCWLVKGHRRFEFRNAAFFRTTQSITEALYQAYAVEFNLDIC